MTRVPAFVERAFRRISSPSAPPMRFPAITRSKTCFSIFSRASLPLWATWTLYPLRLIDWTRPSRRLLSSSATRMFFMPPAPPRGSCWKSCSIQRVNINFEDRESRTRSAFFGSIRFPEGHTAARPRQGIDKALNGSGDTVLWVEDRPGATGRVGVLASLWEKERKKSFHAGEYGTRRTPERSDRGVRSRDQRTQWAGQEETGAIEPGQDIRLEGDDPLHPLFLPGDLDRHDPGDDGGRVDPLAQAVVVPPEHQALRVSGPLPPDQAMDREVSVTAEHGDVPHPQIVGARRPEIDAPAELQGGMHA